MPLYQPGGAMPVTVRTQAGAADTPGAADNGNVVDCTNAAQVVVTLPDEATVPDLQPGYNVNYSGEGAGGLSFAIQGGDSMFGYGVAGYFNASPHASAGQGAMVTALLLRIDGAGNRTWQLMGALA